GIVRGNSAEIGGDVQSAPWRGGAVEVQLCGDAHFVAAGVGEGVLDKRGRREGEHEHTRTRPSRGAERWRAGGLEWFVQRRSVGRERAGDREAAFARAAAGIAT